MADLKPESLEDVQQVFKELSEREDVKEIRFTKKLPFYRERKDGLFRSKKTKGDCLWNPTK